MIRVGRLPKPWAAKNFWVPQLYMVITTVSKRSPCITWLGWVIGWVRLGARTVKATE